MHGLDEITDFKVSRGVCKRSLAPRDKIRDSLSISMSVCVFCVYIWGGDVFYLHSGLYSYISQKYKLVVKKEPQKKIRRFPEEPRQIHS